MLRTARRSQALRGESASHGCLIADTALVRKWLAEGLSIADVLTMLEVRRRFEFSPHDCRTYAVEILSTVRAEIRTTSQPRTTHRKESENAVA
jgi:hypothetical protein